MVGHSTRSFDEFVELLEPHSIEKVVDVRTVPRSRHNPQFEGYALNPALAARRISYEHMPGLGGFRRTTAASLNGGWRNLSFRGYADYMQTPEFAHHLGTLITQATLERIVIMCAEAVPWRCHRSLIADALIVRGLQVFEITSKSATREHMLTSFAAVDGDSITYPPAATTSSSFSEAPPLCERGHAANDRARPARR